MKRNRISAIGIVIFWFVGSAQAAPTQLTLVKEVVGGDATTNDWTLTADGTADNDLSGSGWISGLVAPDTFALSESGGPSSYEAGTWECVGGGSLVGSDLTLSEGENVTCTIINTFVPPVVIFNSDFALPLMPVGDGAGTPVCIDETGLLVEGCDGAVGPEGPQGPTGPEGPQGPEGPPGPDSSTEIKVELCNLFVATVTPPPPLCFNCGNGVNEPLEQCDDGNVADGDGCSSICENEEICDGSNLGLTIGCAAYYEDYSCDGAMQCMTYGWGPCEMPEDVCDYLDNDCNGVVDDSFIIAGLYVDDQHCGGCNNSCIDRFPNATGYCEVQGQAAQCGFTCNVGFVDLNLGAADGCECEITSEICDGLDNDCDGFTDEGC